MDVRDPYSSAVAGRARPAPDRRGPARAALGRARRQSSRARRHLVRRVGPGGAGGQRRRRVQRVGRPRAPDAVARSRRRLGTVRARGRGGRRLQVRGPRRRRPLLLKADPSRRAERRRQTASIVFSSGHAGATRRGSRAGARPSRTRADVGVRGAPRVVAPQHARGQPLAELRRARRRARRVCARLGFTHVELLPVMEHPFSGSWGYQVTGYYAPTSRFGSPDDFRALRRPAAPGGLGVILDWVPAHFPRDEFALARFDGTALYEHDGSAPRRAPRLGHAHLQLRAQRGAQLPASRTRSTGVEYHVDGLRVDAVASMLYLDYSRKPGEWIPNQYGGHEDLEAIAFLARAQRGRRTDSAGRDHGRGGVDRLAGRVTANLRRRARLRLQVEHGLDARHARLLPHDPIHRSYHHDELTFSLHLRLQRELHPAALARRGRPRQGVAARPDARRPLAAAREPARAVRLHVGPPRQEAAVHGRRARTGAGVEPRAEPRLAPARGAGQRACRGSSATSTGTTARSPRSGSATSTRGLRVARADDAPRTCSRSRASRPTPGGPLVFAGNFSPVRPGYGWGCHAAARGGCSSTPTPGLRRLRRRLWRDAHRRGAALERPGVLRRADAAPARRVVARAPRGAVGEERARVWPGRPFPLGATWDGEGTNFSLFSEHAERVELCLFAPTTPRAPRADQRTAYNWHGYLPKSGRGSATATASTGPTTPSRAPLQPREAADRPVRQGDRGRRSAGTRRNAPVLPTPTGAEDVADGYEDAAAIPKCVVIDQAFDWEGDRPARTPWHETVIYELHVKGFTALHPGVREDLRGTYAGLASDAAIAYLQPRRHRGRAAADPPHRRRAVPARQGAHELLGLPSIGYLAPHAPLRGDGLGASR